MLTPIRTLRLAGFAAALALPPAAYAQAPAAPAGAAQEAEVIAMEGEVTARKPGDKDFAPVKIGDKLPQKSEISTGPNSKCSLKLPTATIKVDALTHTGIDKLELKPDDAADAAPGGQKVDTRVKLKFGTVKFNVQKGDLKTDLKISTPNSTTAIAGTEGGVSSYGDQNDQIGLNNGEARTVARSEGNIGQSATGASKSESKAAEQGVAAAAEPADAAALESFDDSMGSDEDYTTADVTGVEAGDTGAGELCVTDVIGGETITDSGQTYTEVVVEQTFNDVYETTGTTTTEAIASTETSAGGTITSLTTDSTSGANTTSVATEVITTQESAVTTLPAPPGPPEF
jgi:hypothetical protein